MANIITDVSGVKNIRMTNARFARSPISSFFSGWSKVRIALYASIGDSGANITGTPVFGVGLCSGSTNILGDATTTHFAGALWQDATVTRFGGTPTRYQINPISPATLVGTTLTTGTNLASTTVQLFCAPAPTCYFVDITKGSPNYTLQLFAYATSTTPSTSEADFLAASVQGVPVATGHTLMTSQTIAVDEATNGTFDHACVWWNQSNPTMDIWAWRLYRLA